jgi:hypothetical protein
MDAKGKNISIPEQVMHASDVIYADTPSFPAAQIKLAFRNSNHIFFRRFPFLTPGETEELINLENEAGRITQFFHSCLFLPENLDLFRQLQVPLLINMRMKASADVPLFDQLLQMFLILAMTDKSSVKKLEVNALEGDDRSFILDIRMAYTSGSIARLIFSTHFSEDQSTIEFFQISKPIVSMKPGYEDQTQQFQAEQHALREFIKAVRHQPAVLISLNEYLQSIQLIQKVAEKLKLRGSFLPDQLLVR